MEETYNKNRYLKRIGWTTWAVKKEGKPIVEVRGFENSCNPKPYQVIVRKPPVPAILTAAQELYSLGEISERDLYEISGKLKKMAYEKGEK